MFGQPVLLIVDRERRNVSQALDRGLWRQALKQDPKTRRSQNTERRAVEIWLWQRFNTSRRVERRIKKASLQSVRIRRATGRDRAGLVEVIAVSGGWAQPQGGVNLLLFNSCGGPCHPLLEVP